MANQEILVVGTKDYDVYAKGVANSPLGCESVLVEELKNNFSDFLKGVNSIFSDIETSIESLEIKEITLNVDVSASGKIRLIGSVEAGVGGGITVKLKKKRNVICNCAI